MPTTRPAASRATTVPGPNSRVFRSQPQSAFPHAPFGFDDAFLKMIQTSLGSRGGKRNAQPADDETSELEVREIRISRRARPVEHGRQRKIGERGPPEQERVRGTGRSGQLRPT